MPRTDAEHVVIELIRQAGGVWDGRSKLFKAFYFAHLYYAADEPGILSDWPIVRMTHGPGIQDSAVLLSRLTNRGDLAIERIHEGPYPECRYRLATKAASASPLPADAVKSIKAAADFVIPKSAAELTQLTQQRSRSWREAKDGEIIDIYVDLLPDEEYDAEKAKLAHLDQIIKDAVLNQEKAHQGIV